MGRHIPFRIPGQCIDCAAELAWNRHEQTLRCDKCTAAVDQLRSSAVRAVKEAIKAGQLQPAKQRLCVDCERPAHDYDHRDYRKPMDVEPVCRPCNQRRGPAVWRSES